MSEIQLFLNKKACAKIDFHPHREGDSQLGKSAVITSMKMIRYAWYVLYEYVCVYVETKPGVVFAGVIESI